jgi:hypothetical protein
VRNCCAANCGHKDQEEADIKDMVESMKACTKMARSVKVTSHIYPKHTSNASRDQRHTIMRRKSVGIKTYRITHGMMAKSVNVPSHIVVSMGSRWYQNVA